MTSTPERKKRPPTACPSRQVKAVFLIQAKKLLYSIQTQNKTRPRNQGLVDNLYINFYEELSLMRRHIVLWHVC